MEVGVVRAVDIEQQMQEAYLDYAMSVIVSRALPDVRDGLKPVHRRILYAMRDLGLRSDQSYKKSARIVGEVLGKYHPHGDAAVYDAMVRMAQAFSMRAPLVDGQGNFGSIDGDPAAAMRYTEARLAEIADEIMADIEQNTVDFVDNFDGSLVEPEVLPARMPNFLVNGASGIAVGMATSVPPHNLGEVCDALLFMLEGMLKNEEVSVEDLLQFVKGPDFPTGGIIYRYQKSKGKGDDLNDRIGSAYAVGRGRVTVQAKVHVEEMSRNRHRLVITELPYQTNKANLVEKIADLARDGKIEGIIDLRDESDRQGMRLVIELSRNVKPKTVLKKLFKMTTLQGTFSINMLALVDGEPRLLPLKRALSLFIEHRQAIITRRSQYQLEQAKHRAHILEGLRVALSQLDEVIDIIRRSRSTESARKNLRQKLDLTELQARAILDMPLRRLVALERKKIETEYKELLKQIKYLEELLQTPKKLLKVITEELTEIREKYATPRRTLIVDEATKGDMLMTARDLVPDEAVIVCVSQSGQVCRWPAEERLSPARGQQNDPISVAVSAKTRDTLYLFKADGQVVISPLHQIPKGQGPGDGLNLVEFSAGDAPAVAGLSLSTDQDLSGYLCLVSRGGRVKRISLSDLVEIRGKEATVMGLDKGDELLTAFLTPGGGEVILVSNEGQAIRFAEEDVRAMGLTAAGVWGMKLGKKGEIVGAGPVKDGAALLVATDQGIGKTTELAEYPSQGRYGQGVIAMGLNKEDGQIIAAAVVEESERVMMLSAKKNNKTLYGKSLPQAARAQTGELLMAIRGRDRLVGLVVLES